MKTISALFLNYIDGTVTWGLPKGNVSTFSKFRNWGISPKYLDAKKCKRPYRFLWRENALLFIGVDVITNIGTQFSKGFEHEFCSVRN